MTDFDYLLVGGGLANALIALAVLDARPGSRVGLVERDRRLGGNHTWCFHAGDLQDGASFAEPLVVRRWDGYDVRFPGHERSLDEPYAVVTAERLSEVAEARLRTSPGSELLLGTTATEVGAREVTLHDGRRLSARVVVDARGPGAFETNGSVAYQKFVGVELGLGRPARRSRPLLMDARVPQTDGFRFFYVLPLSDERVLVEDTYFADGPELDLETLRSGIVAYALGSGLDVRHVLREERGVLPLPSRFVAPRPAAPLAAGYQGGWFHPTTGYSFPVAARLAALIASLAPAELFGSALTRFVGEHARQARFACFLNRLLFAACAPGDRVHVLERFYRLPTPTVRRFYALTTGAGDRARIVCGRPPRGVSVGAALTRGVFS